MFKSMLGKKKSENKEEKEQREMMAKIAKMNLTEMRAYVNNKLKDFPVTEEGLSEVMRRLIGSDSKEHYLKADDDDSKKKKAFDLVILISQNKKINVTAVELIQKFLETYKELIHAFDKEYKDIYYSRLESAIRTGLENIAKRAELKNKMDILKQS